MCAPMSVCVFVYREWLLKTNFTFSILIDSSLQNVCRRFHLQAVACTTLRQPESALSKGKEG